MMKAEDDTANIKLYNQVLQVEQSSYVDNILWPGAKWPNKIITYNFMPVIPEIYKVAATAFASAIGIPAPVGWVALNIIQQQIFKPFDEIQKIATEKALKLWEDVANIKFQRKEDIALQLADILSLPIIEPILKAVGKYDDFANALEKYIGNYIGFPVVVGANIRFGSIYNPTTTSGGLAIPPFVPELVKVDNIRQKIADAIDSFIDPIDKLGLVPPGIKLLKLTNVKLFPFGDVWLNNSVDEMNSPKISVEGRFGFETLIHEIGHALGLKHPNNEDAGGLLAPGPFFPDPNADEASTRYTIMSYREGKGQGSVSPSTPMLYDIAAIQSLYGANFNTRSENTVYSWNPEQPFMLTIWDTGGIDTIDASNQKQWTINTDLNRLTQNERIQLTRDFKSDPNLHSGVEIYLEAGKFSSIGSTKFESSAAPTEVVKAGYNLAIAFGVTIENAIGSAYDDLIVGNDVANTLQGKAGNDTLSGGERQDRLFGDADNDILYGGIGSDILYGGIGNDILYGDSENDLLLGEAGNDTLNGNVGDDVLRGSFGNDSLSGEDGKDRIFGEADNDNLSSG
jgi:RTX calcium-binding nonapeptide repeat (4 copies)